MIEVKGNSFFMALAKVLAEQARIACNDEEGMSLRSLDDTQLFSLVGNFGLALKEMRQEELFKNNQEEGEADE